MSAAGEFRLTSPRAKRKWQPNHEEDALQRQAYEFLCRALPRDAFAFHPANGGFRLPTEAKRLKGAGVLPGCADLLIVVGGRLYAIELKARRGVVSEAQRAFERLCAAASVPYAICRSLADVEQTLRDWGVPLVGRVAA
jgi:hypothetical protein